MPTILWENLNYLFLAAGFTCVIAGLSIVLATLLGLAAAIATVLGPRWLRWVVRAYVYVIRGVPLLILLFSMYYVLPYSGIDLPPMFGGILVIGVYFGAFFSEVFRAAILSLPRSQWDAARCLGMGRYLILTMIVFPQAFRIVAPPYVNTCMMLVKSTSLVSVIGLWELTLAGREIVERTLAPFQILGGVAILYFCLCFTLATIARRLEVTFSYVH